MGHNYIQLCEKVSIPIKNQVFFIAYPTNQIDFNVVLCQNGEIKIPVKA